MSEKFYCVVDAQGYFKKYVYTRADESGQEVVQHYWLLEGERLLDTAPPDKRLHAGSAGFVRPRWDEDTETWTEGATAEELAAWEDEHPDPVSLEDKRAAKQAQNKKALADWLAAHPLEWFDGNTYGTTKEDQNDMALNYMQYQMAVMSGEKNPILEWHTQKKRCHKFSVEDFTALSRAIVAYVYPYLRYQETVKEAIYMTQSAEELDAIEIDYSSVAGSV